MIKSQEPKREGIHSSHMLPELLHTLAWHRHATCALCSACVRAPFQWPNCRYLPHRYIGVALCKGHDQEPRTKQREHALLPHAAWAAPYLGLAQTCHMCIVQRMCTCTAPLCGAHAPFHKGLTAATCRVGTSGSRYVRVMIKSQEPNRECIHSSHMLPELLHTLAWHRLPHVHCAAHVHMHCFTV